MTTQTLTDRQKQIYDFICEQVNEGKSPTFREICDRIGFKSLATIHKHIKALEKKGYIICEKKDRGFLFPTMIYKIVKV